MSARRPPSRPVAASAPGESFPVAGRCAWSGPHGLFLQPALCAGSFLSPRPGRRETSPPPFRVKRPPAGQRHSAANSPEALLFRLPPRRGATAFFNAPFRSCLRAAPSRPSPPQPRASLSPSRAAVRAPGRTACDHERRKGGSPFRPAALLKACENAVRRLLPSSAPFPRDGWEP